MNENRTTPIHSQRFHEHSLSEASRYAEFIGDAERQSVHSSHELEEATPAISAGVGEPEIPTGDENQAKAAYVKH